MYLSDYFMIYRVNMTLSMMILRAKHTPNQFITSISQYLELIKNIFKMI